MHFEWIKKSAPMYKTWRNMLTLLFVGDTSEDLKLKPLLVYRSQNLRAFVVLLRCLFSLFRKQCKCLFIMWKLVLERFLLWFRMLLLGQENFIQYYLSIWQRMRTPNTLDNLQTNLKVVNLMSFLTHHIATSANGRGRLL